MRRPGLTMIETVVAASIFAVASIIIASLFIFNSKLYRVENSISDIKIQKTLFIKNFREAGGAAANVAASRTIGGVLYTSSSSTVIFKLPAMDANRDIISGIFDYTVFYKSGGGIYVETDADPASARIDLKRKLSDKAGNLIFRYDAAAPAAASRVDAYLYLENALANEAVSSSVYLRNK